LSTSERTEFDAWLAAMLKRHGDFTVLVILVTISEHSVLPLCSTYMHVVGKEADWEHIKIMFAGSGQKWDGAAFFPTKGANGGPIDNPTARLRLTEIEAKVTEDRMILNEGHFFDTLGRRIKIEPAVSA
jgi:hypothetical protein